MPMSVHVAPVPIQSRQVYVVATTNAGTEAALRVAMEMAKEHAASPLTIFVPRPKLDLREAGPTDESDRQTDGADRWLLARFGQLLRKIGVRRLDVRTQLCDDVREAVNQWMPPGAIGVVGGRHRLLWPSAEERVAARLRRSGRHVVFATTRG